MSNRPAPRSGLLALIAAQQQTIRELELRVVDLRHARSLGEEKVALPHRNTATTRVPAWLDRIPVAA